MRVRTAGGRAFRALQLRVEAQKLPLSNRGVSSVQERQSLTRWAGYHMHDPAALVATWRGRNWKR